LLPRLEAARELKDSARSRKVAEALAETIADADEFWAVRKAAVDALAGGRGESVRRVLLETLAGDPSSKVRRSAASALGSFDEDDTNAALRMALWNDESYRVRSASARSLGKHERPGSATQLVRALSQQSHRSEVFKGALDGLETMEYSRLRRLCEDWSAYGKPGEARNHALSKLVTLAKDSDDEDFREDLREHLIDLLDDPIYWTVSTAISGLGNLGDAAARPALQAVVADAAHSRHRRSARSALEKLDAPKPAEGDGQDLKAEREAREALERRVEDLEEALEEKDTAE